MVGRASAGVLTQPGPLRLGRHQLATPVVLAPMAGVTNRAYRRLCREHGGGLFISEMITARALLERNPETLRMCSFDEDEHPRSMQLYGTDPVVMFEAARMVADEGLADHIDINMGCPVPKVTRKGGGAALPWKVDLFAAIVQGVVRGAGEDLPVTVKMRMGIDADHLTYRDSAEVAADAGVAWVALHARTAYQLYAGTADWSAIGDLVGLLSDRGVPVLGNGDIWTASDATDMVRRTGCAGVVVGRGCLGRPWLFGELAAAFGGAEPKPEPNLGEVSVVMRRHADLLVEELGAERGPKDFRKHIAWYLKGFSVPHAVRVGLANVSSLEELDDLLAQLDHAQPFPSAVAAGPRGRTSGGRQVTLPQGWLDSRRSSAEQWRHTIAADDLVGGG